MDWVAQKDWPTHLSSSITWRKYWISPCQWPRLETIFSMKLGSCPTPCTYYFLLLFICLNFVFLSIMWISVVHEYVVDSKYVCGRTIKNIVTLQHLANLLFVFLVLVTSFSWWSFEGKYDLSRRRVLFHHEPMSSKKTSCLYSVFFVLVSSRLSS